MDYRHWSVHKGSSENPLKGLSFVKAKAVADSSFSNHSDSCPIESSSAIWSISSSIASASTFDEPPL